MCGVGEKCMCPHVPERNKVSNNTADRRPVDPTPIIQLKVMTTDGEDVTPVDPRSEKALRRSPGANGTQLFMQSRLSLRSI